MEIHDENKKEYASKSLAGTALGFGILDSTKVIEIVMIIS